MFSSASSFSVLRGAMASAYLAHSANGARPAATSSSFTIAVRRSSYTSRSIDTARPGLPAASAMRRSASDKPRARPRTPHLRIRQRRQMERHRARADGGQQIVGIFGGQQQDQMIGRLFQRLQQRIRGLLIGAIDMIDQKHAARSVQRLILRALLQQAHLLDGDLPQRAVRRKGQEIGMRGKQQRIFVALVGWPFFALGDGFGVRLQAQIVLFDFVRAADHAPPRIAAPAWLCPRLPGRPAESSAGCAPAASSRTEFARPWRSRKSVRRATFQCAHRMRLPR